MSSAGDPPPSEHNVVIGGTISQMRGLSLSDSDLSNAKDDMEQQLAYNYMVLQMTSSTEKTDELLYRYINNLTRFSGVQLPPYMVRALHEVSSIAKETENNEFDTFMDGMKSKMAEKDSRQDPAKFYDHLGLNLCHVGTMLRTMGALLLESKEREDSDTKEHVENEDLTKPTKPSPKTEPKTKKPLLK